MSTNLLTRRVHILTAIHVTLSIFRIRVADSGTWRDRSASYTYHSVCEKAATAGSCSSGWSLFAGHCYQLDTSYRSWSAAKTNCENLGAFLAETHNAEINAFVSDLLTTADAWLGARSVTKIRWTDGSPVGAYDGGDEPDSGDRCVYSDDGDWKDKDCHHNRHPVCKVHKRG